MAISYKGYRENILTFNSDITKVGVPVIVGANSKVFLASADTDFIGFTCYADGKLAGVIVDGYVEVPYTGNAPLYGSVSLVSNGSNGVKTASSSSTTKHVVRVIKLDTANKIVGFIL